jgi:DNA-directed RNA polymerase subunit RPC12/RpoP
MITFVCDGCGAELQIGDQWAGKLGRCPHCGTNSRVPGNPKRTSKLVILARIVALPFAVLAFWAFFLSLGSGWMAVYFVLGGVGAVVGALFFLWAVTNIGTYLCSPYYYKLWKKNGGDPFWDSLNSPINNDPPETKYQELFREQARQECEEVDRMFGLQPQTPPDSTKSINDPSVI